MYMSSADLPLIHYATFSMVGGYMKNLQKNKQTITVKIVGWELVRGWVLARDNTVCLLAYSTAICAVYLDRLDLLLWQ